MKNILLIAVTSSCLLLGIVGCSPIDWFGGWKSGSDFYQGENGESFRAKIDATDWYPQERTEFVQSSSPINAKYYNNSDGTHSFSLEVFRDESPHSVVTVNCSAINGIGTHTFGDSSSGSWASYSRRDTLPDKSFSWNTYKTDKLHSGELAVSKIDTSLRLISGTVSFSASYGNSVVNLKEGVFVVSYR